MGLMGSFYFLFVFAFIFVFVFCNPKVHLIIGMDYTFS